MPPKNSLGKGLGAMFPDLLQGIDDGVSYIVCGIEELTPNPFQARQDFNDDDQKQLVASVKKSGIIQPIVVRKSVAGYEIIAGERRWRAAQKAGLKNVPVIIREAGDLEVAELSLIENLQREALNPVEEAKAYQILAGQFGLSQEDISMRVGKDRSTITNSLRLLKLSPAIQRAIIEKKITSGHARPLLGIASPGEQAKMLAVILKKALTVRDTERLVKKLNKTSPSAKETTADPYTRDLEQTLSDKMMARVKIHQNDKKSGRIEILFNSMDDLNRLAGVLLDE